MPNIDLSDYAGLFLFCLFAICAALSYLNYRIYGKLGSGITVVLAIVGIWISIGVVNLADFDDASPETVMTIGIGSLVLPIIYSFVSIRGWIVQKKKKRIEDKVQVLQRELKDIEEKNKYEKAMVNLLSLLNKCDIDVSAFEKHPQVVAQKMLISKADSLNKEIQNLSKVIQSGGQI